MSKNSDYEFFLVLSVKMTEEMAESIINKFKELIESNGVLTSVDKWGKHKLAYLIQHETDGFYVLFNFSSGPELSAEINRVCNISDGILRNLVVKKC